MTGRCRTSNLRKKWRRKSLRHHLFRFWTLNWDRKQLREKMRKTVSHPSHQCHIHVKKKRRHKLTFDTWCHHDTLIEAISQEQKRKEHQRMIEDRAREEAIARFSNDSKPKQAGPKRQINTEAYKDPSQFPTDLERNKVRCHDIPLLFVSYFWHEFSEKQQQQLDTWKMTLVSNMYKWHLYRSRSTNLERPFWYLSMVFTFLSWSLWSKMNPRVTTSWESILTSLKTITLRRKIPIIFPAACPCLSRKSYTGTFWEFFPPKSHIQILKLFRCSDPRSLNALDRGIKELRKKITARETERREVATLVTQEKLVLSRRETLRPLSSHMTVRMTDDMWHVSNWHRCRESIASDWSFCETESVKRKNYRFSGGPHQRFQIQL